jgi:cellulose synthase/poly-beta-1,6-N-acetylglucosamine synthase-like glycosyltransferase
MGQGTGLAGRAPSFSVVVPTRNGPGQLAECLASLAAQDYPADRFEVVVSMMAVIRPSVASRDRSNMGEVHRPQTARSGSRDGCAAGPPDGDD